MPNYACDTWPVRWACDISAESNAVTGIAAQAATEVLWSLSGRQFGTCTYTLRPQRKSCGDLLLDNWIGYGGGNYWGSGDFRSDYLWPMPIIVNDCVCNNGYEAVLPDVVSSILEVKVDGVIQNSSTYRLDNDRILVRIGAQWPYYNNTALPDSAVGTWSVKAQFGTTVPMLGQIAMGEMACQFLRALNGQDCNLPRNLTNLARQGVNLQFADVATAWDAGRTGLYTVDVFIASVNPNNLRRRGKVYRVDGDRSLPRRVVS